MRNELFVVMIVIGINSILPIKAPASEVMERLALLKKQLAADIQQSRLNIGPMVHNVMSLHHKNLARSGPITPVTRRKKNRQSTKTPIRFFIRKRNVTTTTTTEEDIIEHTMKPLRISKKEARAKARKWERHVKKFGSPQEIFYRRDFMKSFSEAEIKKRHALLCVDLLRPVLAGFKKNATVAKIVGDQTANRLIQLLSYGNAQTPEEIESIMYQINNLHLRFFQWEVSSIKKLFNFIMPGQRHSFKSMKHGVKRIFEMWDIDLNNTNILIKESRMFRPPCIGATEGSTRSSKNTLYTKPATPKSTCKPKDKKCLVQASSSLED